eukprot:m.5911 g.5911  ORF g.5911 m.5911 type:complete len:285 (+) comp8055_c0_seq1:131-985(+)
MNPPDVRLNILRNEPLFFDVEASKARFKEVPSAYPKRSARLLIVDWVLLFSDYFQLAALFINTAQRSGQWEKLLMDQLSWMTLPALDLYGYLSSLKYPGNDTPIPSASVPFNYQAYFYAWMALPALLYLIKRLTYKLTDCYRQSGFIPRRSKISGWIFLLSYVLVSPIGLGLLRLPLCREYPGKGSVLLVDNDIACSSSQSLILTMSGVLVATLFATVLGGTVWRQIRRVGLATSDTQHEAQLRLLESNYSKGIDERWMTKRLYLQSSFTRRGAYYYVRTRISA